MDENPSSHQLCVTQFSAKPQQVQPALGIRAVVAVGAMRLKKRFDFISPLVGPGNTRAGNETAQNSNNAAGMYHFYHGDIVTQPPDPWVAWIRRGHGVR